MSFYTALTGLNGAQADISATSNNIANVGTTGFKRSRAEFGDIFATSPLQNASSSIGSGTILKGIKQQFTQGNIASSLNALDLAISGQGFFALQPSLTSSQTVYTRNGSFNVDNDRYVVDSAGQYLMTYPVNTDGSVTAKDLQSAVPLQLPVTSGDPKATSNIELGVNVPADAPVITAQEQFADGYVFNPDDASTYTNSTSITIFDDLGNPTIATIYFIKTQTASADDPTNKYDTRLVINETIIDPNLVSAVDDAGQQLFVDRFGNQTTQVPDDNYFLEGKGSPLYKLDDLKRQVDSEPASIQGGQSAFDFGEEGDKLVEIVTDPLMFPATREAGNADSDIFWGKDFLLVNVDDSDAPVSIDIRPGKYNAEQLAAEVERAINTSYGDDKKFQLFQNVDDTLTIDFFKQGTDGTSEGLSVTSSTGPIEIDLLQPTYVSTISGIDVEGASPDFTREEFMAHAQTRIVDAMNEYIYDSDGVTLGSGAQSLGVEGRLFTRTTGQAVSSPYTSAEIVTIDNAVDLDNAAVSVATKEIPLSEFTISAARTYTLTIGNVVLTTTGHSDSESLLEGLKSHTDYDSTNFTIEEKDNRLEIIFANPELSTEVASLTDDADTPISATADIGSKEHYLAYSYYGKTPTLEMYDSKHALENYAIDGSTQSIVYDKAQNTLTIYVPTDFEEPSSSSIRLMGSTADDNFANYLNGRELRVFENTVVTDDNSISYRRLRIDTSGLNLPETGFEISDGSEINVLSNPSQTLEAFYEGAESNVAGQAETFNSRKIILRETGAGANRETTDVSNSAAITIGDALLNPDEALVGLGLIASSMTTKLAWVDELSPPVRISYDDINQRLQYTVDRTVLGTGTGSNFNSFTVYGAADAEGTNGIGIPAANNASEVLIRGGEILSTSSFIADGEEIQLNDKRYGIEVKYNSDTKSFSVSSGTTGEDIAANGALGVNSAQKASNIQIGRRSIGADGNIDTSETIDLNAQIIGLGSNALFGFDANSDDFLFTGGRGLASQPAIATGRAAQSDLSEVFRLNSTNGENIFNVSVNGVNGIIEMPAGNYVGTTLASALEQRINQISDPETGATIGGVSVRYSPEENNFFFTTGTTGDASTIKVKGTARLGLAEVPLGVGSVPKIFNLVQATNDDGVALYVDASGNVVTSPPENLVEGYYPLYIDEGELTFDKTGRLVSPRNNVSYEQQAEGFSISLDIDYSASTQFAQPFSVLSVEQDGFTSGRLDGLEIDSSGTIRANYTNGQNTPLGKIVVANFNNQNGLKQIGNATYVETAVSGTPQVGEAGSEGFGNILSGSLERSNVDITEELVNLITAQRNYQASAKAIETTTSLTQTIINIRM
jgi:flagellar hook protein FlgE